MKEIWKDIKGYEGLYQVSNLGRVKSLERKVLRSDGTSLAISERILKLGKNARGYLSVQLCANGIVKCFRVYRLVAQAFIPNPDNKPQVNHIDGNKQNNRADNLEWATRSENMQHAYKTGLFKLGENSSQAKLTNEQTRAIREEYVCGSTTHGQCALAKKHHVSRKTIYNIIHNKSYKDI